MSFVKMEHEPYLPIVNIQQQAVSLVTLLSGRDEQSASKSAWQYFRLITLAPGEIGRMLQSEYWNEDLFGGDKATAEWVQKEGGI